MTGSVDSSLHIDHLRLAPVLRPSDLAELQQVVEQARADTQPLYPFGGQTALHVGLPPHHPGTAVDLRALHQVVDYPARDLTITVAAGIRMAELAQTLAQENQWLPLDVPQPEAATLGGTLALNRSGPRRYGYGTLRDYVIGIAWVNDQAAQVKAGGRVVKNVAGYDLAKLLIGSLGTLGIVTQVTLKVLPRPATSRILESPLRLPQLATILDRVHASRTRPVAVELGKQQASGWRLYLGYEGSEQAVAWQLDQITQELADLAPLTPVADATATWRELTQFPANAQTTLSFQATLPPSRLAEYLGEIDALPLDVQAHAGNGIVRGHWQTPAEATLEAAQQLVASLERLPLASGGALTLPRCPTPWKTILPVWGRERPEWQLMRVVKAQLDPHGRFNPGRFVGGL